MVLDKNYLDRQFRVLVLTPEIILHLVRRFSVEAVPDDISVFVGEPINISVHSTEFSMVGWDKAPPDWSPVLNITHTKVDDAIDELKCGLDLLIDACPVDVHGEEIYRRAKNHFAQALTLLTERLETGGEHGET